MFFFIAKKDRTATNLLISDPRLKAKRRKLNDGTAQMEATENEQINSFVNNGQGPTMGNMGNTFDGRG